MMLALISLSFYSYVVRNAEISQRSRGRLTEASIAEYQFPIYANIGEIQRRYRCTEFAKGEAKSAQIILIVETRRRFIH